METRAKVEKQLAAKKKEEKEEKLRELAQRARDERAGIRTVAGKFENLTVCSGLKLFHDCIVNIFHFVEKDDELREREEIRKERHRERQRDRNLARAGADKRNRIQRERDRDISEKIALGLPNTGVSKGDSEAMFDQRLFNKDRVCLIIK